MDVLLPCGLIVGSVFDGNKFISISGELLEMGKKR
jgi:hypothetical protein